MIEVDKRFYHEDNYYNNDIYGEYREDIKQYINEYKTCEYDKIIEKDKRTNIVSIFSEMRANVIKWYPFEENKKILEIGANYGEITEELARKNLNITAIETSNEKIECLQKRLEHVANLRLILCTNLKELELEEKYDYITLIGTAEYAEKLGFVNLKEMLEWTYRKLSENGKIILAIDNKFGVKYLAGSTRNNKEAPFANYIENKNKDYKLYGKVELEEILKEFSNSKFYYPVPNYTLTHMIYTDEYLPKRNRYNIYYREDEEILFSELAFMGDIIRNKKFDFFTNSYIIEISKENVSDICFVNYSNMRKKEYKIITKLSQNQAEKEAYNQYGKEHIEQIKENIDKLKELGFSLCETFSKGKIESKFIKKPTMDEYLEELINHGEYDKFEEELEKWYNILKERFTQKSETSIFEKYDVKISKEEKENLTILKDGFIDLVFQNIFYDGKSEYLLFDQEWYEEGAPLELIMYRSIGQLAFQHNNIKGKINFDKLYEKYNIKKYIKIFNELEEKWQKTLVDKDILDFYTEKWKRIISIEDIKFNCEQELGKVYAEKDNLSDENKKLKQEIAQLKASKIYRWTKFLRRKKFLD